MTTDYTLVHDYGDLEHIRALLVQHHDHHYLVRLCHTVCWWELRSFQYRRGFIVSSDGAVVFDNSRSPWDLKDLLVAMCDKDMVLRGSVIHRLPGLVSLLPWCSPGRAGHGWVLETVPNLTATQRLAIVRERDHLYADL